VTGPGGTSTVGFQATYPGCPAEVGLARAEVARYLRGCPVVDDAILIVSELATNAVTHSASGQRDFFTVRAEWHDTYVFLEVEDAGGEWRLHPSDPDRPHGLQMIEALTGIEGWGIDGSPLGRVVWARLDIAGELAAHA